jgi:hypothetical protein
MALYEKITPESVRNPVGTPMPIAILLDELNPPPPVSVGDGDVDVGSRDVVENGLLVGVVKVCWPRPAALWMLRLQEKSLDRNYQL